MNANRSHANRPSALTVADRAKLARPTYDVKAQRGIAHMFAAIVMACALVNLLAVAVECFA